jgi:hypothetical protein
MSDNTNPIFIVGSGRSGTRSFYRMLTGSPGLEIHHEYAVNETQRLAALFFMGKVDSNYVRNKIKEMHGASIHYSAASTWIDSSNKLSWLIEPVSELFPQSRFLAIVRDGRKVVSSFYYKLREEMYDDASTKLLKNWLDGKDDVMPPAEKPIWWNIPQTGQPWHDEFPSFDRLQRVSYHWAEVNRVIIESFSKIAADRVMLVRLEDLVSSESKLDEVLEFLNIPKCDAYAEYLKTPRNVFMPLDFQLTKSQLRLFDQICDPMMTRLGYTQKEAYRVSY